MVGGVGRSWRYQCYKAVSLNLMTHFTGQDRAEYLREMFDRISERYDLTNRLMTFGQDVRWRRRLLEKANLPTSGLMLDLGTGTGDVPLEALRIQTGILPVGADFSEGMLRAGRLRPGGSRVLWLSTDATCLPFSKCTFDVVSSAFLVRNVIDLERVFSEQWRVLRPGGKVVCLETTPTVFGLLQPAVQFHLHCVIPFLGQIIAGHKDAYTYLSLSTDDFLSAESLAKCIRAAGFRDVVFQRMMFGAVALHWGVK